MRIVKFNWWPLYSGHRRVCSCIISNNHALFVCLTTDSILSTSSTYSSVLDRGYRLGIGSIAMSNRWNHCSGSAKIIPHSQTLLDSDSYGASFCIHSACLDGDNRWSVRCPNIDLCAGPSVNLLSPSSPCDKILDYKVQENVMQPIEASTVLPNFSSTWVWGTISR